MLRLSRYSETSGSDIPKFLNHHVNFETYAGSFVAQWSEFLVLAWLTFQLCPLWLLPSPNFPGFFVPILCRSRWMLPSCICTTSLLTVLRKCRPWPMGQTTTIVFYHIMLQPGHDVEVQMVARLAWSNHNPARILDERAQAVVCMTVAIEPLKMWTS
jgi:hypothetical protein